MTVNGPQNFAVTRAGNISVPKKILTLSFMATISCSSWSLWQWNILQSWRKYTEYGEKGRKLDWLQFVLCRSSLLQDIDTTVYGSHVKVLPTEDFLSVRVLVSFSPLPQFPLSEVNKCLQPWWEYVPSEKNKILWGVFQYWKIPLNLEYSCSLLFSMAANRNLFFISLQVDRSIVESFVQGGRMAITSRVYPRVAVDNLANLYLFNNGTTPVTVRSVDVYQMTHVVMHPI